MTTFLTLQDNVLGHQFSETKYRTFVETQINRAIRDIARRIDMRTEIASSSITTTASVATSVLPSDFCRFIDLRNTTDQDLLAPMELRDYDEANSSSGKPIQYVVIGSNITFYPTPDAAYSLSLRYWPFPTALSGDTDESPFSVDFDQAIEDFALHRCYRRENDHEQAQQHQNAYETELQKLMGQFQHDTAEGPTQVQGTWNGRTSGNSYSWTTWV